LGGKEILWGKRNFGDCKRIFEQAVVEALILGEFVQFSTLLIFIPTYIPSNKLIGFQLILDIYSTKVVVMLVGRRYCT
jgi:hypothetical protein